MVHPPPALHIHSVLLVPSGSRPEGQHHLAQRGGGGGQVEGERQARGRPRERHEPLVPRRPGSLAAPLPPRHQTQARGPPASRPPPPPAWPAASCLPCDPRARACRPPPPPPPRPPRPPPAAGGTQRMHRAPRQTKRQAVGSRPMLRCSCLAGRQAQAAARTLISVSVMRLKIACRSSGGRICSKSPFSAWHCDMDTKSSAEMRLQHARAGAGLVRPQDGAGSLVWHCDIDHKLSALMRLQHTQPGSKPDRHRRHAPEESDVHCSWMQQLCMPTGFPAACSNSCNGSQPTCLPSGCARRC